MSKETMRPLVESRTNGGVTPLMYAVSSGNIYMVGECLNQGMNPFTKDYLDQSPIEYASPFNSVNGQNIKQLIQQA